MSADVAAVLAAAESLPAERRRVIAARLADYEAGRVGSVPWPEVLARWESKGHPTPAPTDHQIARDALDRMPLTATLDEMSEELALLAALRSAAPGRRRPPIGWCLTKRSSGGRSS